VKRVVAIQELIPNPMFEEMNRQYLQKESSKRIALLLSKNTEIVYNRQTKKNPSIFPKCQSEKLLKMNSVFQF
jgi:hypothetical protein